MAHECIMCTSRKKEGVFVYVSQICVCYMHVGTSLLCKCEHILLEFFFVFDTTYTYISPPLLISQGVQRCDDFNITCVWCSFCKRCYEFFFSFILVSLKEALFLSYCVAQAFPCSPYTCVLPLLPPSLGHRAARKDICPCIFVWIERGNNRRWWPFEEEKKKTVVHAIVFSNSPPNLWHL